MKNTFHRYKVFIHLFHALLYCIPGYNYASSVNEQAYQDLKSKSFPLTAQQIHDYKDKLYSQKKAAAMPPGDAPPQGESSIILASLKPNSTQPVVRISKGMISSIIMTDKLGNVWPIKSYSIGDTSKFNIHWDKSGGVLMVQGLKAYGQTNIGIILKGLQIPVMISLVLGQSKWDYMEYIRVQSYQNGEKNSQYAIPSSPDYLIQLLNGIPPKGAHLLKTSEPSSIFQAWSYQGQYLLLTSGVLISPGFHSSQSSTGPNMMHAYLINKSPAVLVSIAGDTKQISIHEDSI